MTDSDPSLSFDGLATQTAFSGLNALSVDVEDYFQVWAFQNQIDRKDWDSYECRIEANVERLLELFAAHEARATFFWLGWAARKLPQLARRVADAGHEIASHGTNHQLVHHQSPEEFRADVHEAKQCLEDLCGTQVLGYRAPSFSIDARNLWAFEILADCGYRYSSSIYPIRHDHYGMPEAPRFAFRVGDTGITEFPVTTVQARNIRLPAGGGGYFRLLPYGLAAAAIRRVNSQDQQPSIFYMHPWEIDPGQPRIPGVSWKSRIRHYTNLGRVEGKLGRLLSDFRWASMGEVFAPCL